jgi:hypothetical protein
MVSVAGQNVIGAPGTPQAAWRADVVTHFIRDAEVFFR